MPQVIDIIRLRRRRTEQKARYAGWGLIFRTLLGSISLFILIAALVLALFQSQISADLPGVRNMQAHFGTIGREGYEPVRFYDREGEVVLFEAFNSHATEARWLYVQDEGLIELQEHTLRALLAAVDPEYLSRPKPTTLGMLRDFFTYWLQGSVSAPMHIPEALVEAQLLPLGTDHIPDTIQQARIHLLGQELSREYSKSQILEWFVNSSDFGRDLYGIDAAALVYLGKHAGELSLAESALLAPIVLQPSINPFSAPQESRERQVRVVETMLELGWISGGEAQAAKQEAIDVQKSDRQERTPLQEILAVWIRERLGAKALNRSGLTVYTTIDAELQQQAECTLAAQLLRLAGGIGNETVPAADGSACLAANLLPPLRPRDQGLNHEIEEGAFIVLDPQTGEIRALAGQVNVSIEAKRILYPLIYLTAFSQGYGPGSMILDLPLGGVDSDRTSLVSSSAEDFQGPVRIRTALANQYASAAQQMLTIVGVEGVQRIAQNLGFNLPIWRGEDGAETDLWEVSLIDVSAAYGVLAYQGQKVGAKLTEGQASTNRVDLDPEILFEVEDNNRRLVYRYHPESRPVVSSQLAFLLNDILSDEPARWPLYGTGNPFELGLPTAVTAGTSADERVAWTIGYSPSVVVGVWIGNLSEVPPQQLEISNSAAAVWHALMQYVTRELPAQDWAIPPGINAIEVCDPSGLLPTIYCPEVVNEVFAAGTEPITFDNLYQPFQVNRETGKLATLFTPTDQIEERVYLVPPPEAMAWALEVGLEQPPSEYDTLTGEMGSVPGVAIRTPESFDFVRGVTSVNGEATIEDFSNYRLQYGEGLNPTEWIQIGGENRARVASGRLGSWDTAGLDGLYTLQLIVVDGEGQLFTSAVNLTIDNQPPDLEVILPEEGQEIDSESTDVVLQVSASDAYGVSEVTFYIDGELIEVVSTPPYSRRWVPSAGGEYAFYAEAVDYAGNAIQTEMVNFEVLIGE